MEFTLTYRGPLSASKQDVGNKHHIRRAFHRQLAVLWATSHLQGALSILGQPWPTMERGGIEFRPLVIHEYRLVADLAIQLFRPEAHGHVLSGGGDIDNRLKTLFDAMSVPPHGNQIPPNVDPSAEPSPFFCVLADDSLVTSVAVNTAQLLDVDQPIKHSEVLLIVRVTTRHTTPVFAPL